MGRRLFVIGLAIALQAGALTAPLVHAHVGDHHDDHHDAARVHAHMGSHAAGHHAHSGGAAVDEADASERVIAVALFVATQAEAGLEPAVAPALFVVAPPGASLMRRRPQVVRSHGPPPVTASSPRAPPVFLS